MKGVHPFRKSVPIISAGLNIKFLLNNFNLVNKGEVGIFKPATMPLETFRDTVLYKTS